MLTGGVLGVLIAKVIAWFEYRIPLAVQRRAMGIDWMSLGKLSQAIPPAYSEFLGRAATAARSAGIGAQP
jgi:hypothetical protein